MPRASTISADQYEKYKNLIYKRSWHYAEKLQIAVSGKYPDFNIEEYQRELVAIGNVAFLRSLETFDPALSKFSTYLWNGLDLAFFREHRKMLKSIYEDSTLELADIHESNPALRAFCPIESRVNFWQSIALLSAEAREVVDIITTSPVEVLNLAGHEPPKIIRGILKRYLRSEGWSHPRIWKAFKEVRGFCKVGVS